MDKTYNYGFPSTSRGCYTQAWGVGEVLRVYNTLYKNSINNYSFMILCF